MAAQTRSSSDNLLFLRRTLQADGLVCLASGVIVALASEPFSTLIGLSNPAALAVIGVILAVYGAGLVYLSSTQRVDRRLTITVIGLNIAWVIGSALILLANTPLTTEGRWAVLIVADIVTLFALVEFTGLRRMTR